MKCDVVFSPLFSLQIDHTYRTWSWTHVTTLRGKKKDKSGLWLPNCKRGEDIWTDYFISFSASVWVSVCHAQSLPCHGNRHAAKSTKAIAKVMFSFCEGSGLWGTPQGAYAHCELQDCPVCSGTVEVQGQRYPFSLVLEVHHFPLLFCNVAEMGKPCLCLRITSLSLLFSVWSPLEILSD